MIKIPVAKIWTHPERRPDPFDGCIVPSDIKATKSEDCAETQNQAVHSPKESDSASIAEIIGLSESEVNIQTQTRSESETKNTTKQPAIANTPNHKQEDDSDRLNFLPTVTQEIDKKPSKVEKISNSTRIENKGSQSESGKSGAENPNTPNPLLAPLNQAVKTSPDKSPSADPVDDFFAWLQHGIQTGAIKTNQPKARVHVVKEGVALMTPGIFQDFAQAQDHERSNWTSIQKKVLKKNWHVKDEQGLNVIKYQITGANKTTTANVIL